MLSTKLLTACRRGDLSSFMPLLFASSPFTRAELTELIGITATYQHPLIKKILECYAGISNVPNSDQAHIASAMVFYLMTHNKNLADYPQLLKPLSSECKAGFIELAVHLKKYDALSLLSQVTPRHLPHVRTATYWAARNECSEEIIKQVSPTPTHYAVALEQLENDKYTAAYDFLKAQSSAEAIKIYQADGEEQKQEEQDLSARQIRKYEALSSADKIMFQNHPFATMDYIIILKILAKYNWVALHSFYLFKTKEFNFSSAVLDNTTKVEKDVTPELFELCMIAGATDLLKLLVYAQNLSLISSYWSMPGITYSLLARGLSSNYKVTKADRMLFASLYTQNASCVVAQLQQAFQDLYNTHLDLSLLPDPSPRVRLDNSISLSSYAQLVISAARFGIPMAPNKYEYDFRANDCHWNLFIPFCNTIDHRILRQVSKFTQEKIKEFVPTAAWIKGNKNLLAAWALFSSQSFEDLNKRVAELQKQLKVTEKKLAKLEGDKLRSGRAISWRQPSSWFNTYRPISLAGIIGTPTFYFLSYGAGILYIRSEIQAVKKKSDLLAANDFNVNGTQHSCLDAFLGDNVRLPNKNGSPVCRNDSLTMLAPLVCLEACLELLGANDSYAKDSDSLLIGVLVGFIIMAAVFRGMFQAHFSSFAGDAKIEEHTIKRDTLSVNIANYQAARQLKLSQEDSLFVHIHEPDSATDSLNRNSLFSPHQRMLPLPTEREHLVSEGVNVNSEDLDDDDSKVEMTYYASRQ
jgi:hypothetical protein